jgi:hypothetical protein
MKIKIMGLLLVLIPQLSFGYCYYVNCYPSVAMATVMTTMSMEKEFLKINYEINEIKRTYQQYADVLNQNNLAYQKNEELKQEYLLLLKEINHNQQLLLR